MDTSAKRKLAAGAAAALVVAGGGVAVGAKAFGSPKEESQAVIADAAKQLGIEPAKLSAALKTALEHRVDAAVESGRLTKAQGDALKARIDSGEMPLFPAGRPPSARRLRPSRAEARRGRRLPRLDRGAAPHRARERQDPGADRECPRQDRRGPGRRARRRRAQEARRSSRRRPVDPGRGGLAAHGARSSASPTSSTAASPSRSGHHPGMRGFRGGAARAVRAAAEAPRLTGVSLSS